jgi:hypothetical protein
LLKIKDDCAEFGCRRQQSFGKTTSLLQRKLQHYRQEEITEEIEVLLLNATKTP